MTYKKRLKWGKWLLPAIGVLVFIMTLLLNRFPRYTEQYYSQKVYPALATAISFFSKWIPFSLADLFYLLLIVTGLATIIMLILRKLSLPKGGILLLNVLSGAYAGFYILWGFNYFRDDLNTRLTIKVQKPDEREFMVVFNSLIDDVNQTYASFDDFSASDASVLTEQSFREMAPVLGLNYPSGIRRAKAITLSGFFAKAGISGYFGPFFNEIHVNKKLLPVEYPFVLTHEKAHQFGITGEAEANFYAWMVCRNSRSVHLRYSANLVALRYFINHGFGREGYQESISRIDKKVIEDIRRIQHHWRSIRNDKVEAVAARVNDAYLKTNQVEEGIRDYTGVVKYIMDFSLDSAFQRKVYLKETF